VVTVQSKKWRRKVSRKSKWLGVFVSVLVLLLPTYAGITHGATLHAKPRLPFAGRNLVMATWGGVWTQNTKKYFGDPFSKATGAKVIYVDIGTAGPGAEALQQEKTGNVQWDLLDSGGTDVWVLEKAGDLVHFPQPLLAELKRLSRPGQVENFNLEYGDTASIIACNPKIMKKCPTNARQFWDTKDYPGPRAFSDNAYTAMVFAEEAMGVPLSKIYPINISKAIAKLRQIKSAIKVWPSSGQQMIQVMVDGEVGVSVMWNGRAYTAYKTAMPQLKMYWNGAEVGQGGLAVVKGGPDTDVALAYIKWFAEHPKNQALWTEALTYPTPTKELLKLLPPDIAKALPAAHPHIITDDNNWIVAHTAQVEKAWQQFITSS
jgi:spermidine/putrescine-binding protein